MSEDMTNTEWLRFIADDFCKLFSETERERFNIIAARLEQFEAEHKQHGLDAIDGQATMDEAYNRITALERENAEWKRAAQNLLPILDYGATNFIPIRTFVERVAGEAKSPTLGPNPTVDGLRETICQAHMAGQRNQGHCDPSWYEAVCYYDSLKTKQPDGSVGPEKEDGDESRMDG